MPVPTGAGCVAVSEILALAHTHAGEYSFGGVAETLPAFPGLSVKGVGMVSLPLLAEQAEKVITQCEKSPFGHNMDTEDGRARSQKLAAPTGSNRDQESVVADRNGPIIC